MKHFERVHRSGGGLTRSQVLRLLDRPIQHPEVVPYWYIFVPKGATYVYPVYGIDLEGVEVEIRWQTTVSAASAAGAVVNPVFVPPANPWQLERLDLNFDFTGFTDPGFHIGQIYIRSKKTGARDSMGLYTF